MEREEVSRDQKLRELQRRMEAGDEEAANELFQEKLRGGWVKKILTRIIRLERASAVRVHNPITAQRVDEALAYYASVTTADMIEWLDRDEPVPTHRPRRDPNPFFSPPDLRLISRVTGDRESLS